MTCEAHYRHHQIGEKTITDNVRGGQPNNHEGFDSCREDHFIFLQTKASLGLATVGPLFGQQFEIDRKNLHLFNCVSSSMKRNFMEGGGEGVREKYTLFCAYVWTSVVMCMVIGHVCCVGSCMVICGHF